MNQGRRFLVPALIGGAAAGVASAVPVLSCLNCACCALVIGGGFLAAFLYLKDAPPAAAPPYGDGALLGLLTGAFTTVIKAVVEIPFHLLTLHLEPDLQSLREALRNADVSREVREMMMDWIEMLERASQSDVTVGVIVVLFFVKLVVFSLFALLGALLGVAMFHKKAPPADPYAGTPPAAPGAPPAAPPAGYVPPPSGQAPPPSEPPGSGTPPPPPVE